jgi:hypothetical protein
VERFSLLVSLSKRSVLLQRHTAQHPSSVIGAVQTLPIPGDHERYRSLSSAALLSNQLEFALCTNGEYQDKAVFWVKLVARVEKRLVEEEPCRGDAGSDGRGDGEGRRRRGRVKVKGVDLAAVA